jgi:hypothetical protein
VIREWCLHEQRRHVGVNPPPPQPVDCLVAVGGGRGKVNVDPPGLDPDLGTHVVFVVHERPLGVVVAHHHRPECRRDTAVLESVELVENGRSNVGRDRVPCKECRGRHGYRSGFVGPPKKTFAGRRSVN